MEQAFTASTSSPVYGTSTRTAATSPFASFVLESSDPPVHQPELAPAPVSNAEPAGAEPTDTTPEPANMVPEPTNATMAEPATNATMVDMKADMDEDAALAAALAMSAGDAGLDLAARHGRHGRPRRTGRHGARKLAGTVVGLSMSREPYGGYAWFRAYPRLPWCCSCVM
jgi:hypothetical protein